ncbi:protein MLN51 homolog isoform X3 [Hordeum vulgare subsp. vulgare]|uniref:protein MLN51 homolog isoform X3 n=1 Tax=Hordeum vulgare subsp. vulgare TaxID=112509 RepID=UPI001D1A4AAF|nr:protein MLN51 homolog isoform X3 [Hordeum vulgare subsp. vulgare]
MAATAAGDEEEELSDVNDSPLPALRRREAASDDDDEGDGGGGGGGSGSPPPSRVAGSDSDPDSEELGAAEVYDEDEGSEECEEARKEFDAGSNGGGEAKEVAPDEVAAAPEDGEAQAETGAELEEEDKESKGSEPHAVPRTGAFYMHDDRFQNKENRSPGRQRDFFGGQKLWNSEDDSVWLHDRFDEINTHYVQHDSTRRPGSPFRAWAGGKTYDVNHGYLQGTKSAFYYHDYGADYKYGSTNNYNRFPEETNTSYYSANNYRSVPRKSHLYYDEKNFYNARAESRICYVNAKGYNNAPNVNRGKPSRPYQPHWKNTFETSSVQNNRTYSRSQNEEGCSDTGVGKNSHRTLSLQNEQEFPSKQEFPFIERRKSRPDILSKLFSSSIRMAHSSLKPQSRPSFGVKAFAPSGEHGNTAGSLSMIKGMPDLGSRSSLSTSNSQYSKSRDQGSGLNIGGPTKNNLSSTSQATRSYTEFSNAVYQQRSVQQPLLLTPSESTQIFHQNIASTSKIQSHPQNTLTNPPPGSNKSLAPSVIIAQNDKAEAVSGSCPCGDHALDVTGAKGLTLGTPAVLSVMKFSGQHPRGPDIPCTGMDVPGLLVHQSSDISELSQITWLQTLSGATGVLGETYDPSYIGSHYPQPSAFPRNRCVTEVPVLLNSPEIPEVVGHELGQRKNKLLRYSEMNFASLT